MYFQEVKSIPLDVANSNNFDNMILLYYNEYDAVEEFNNSLLDFYRVILGESE